MPQRALLILIGGRQIPNLLTAQYLKPDIIVPIASHEALRPGDAWSKIEPALGQLCPQGLEAPLAVDAFDTEGIRAVCRNALNKYPEATWVCNITCATTIMSIGAYEAAQQIGASVWYLDTAGGRVVTLARTPPEGNLYHLKVADYMDAYGRRPKEPDAPPPQLIEFAQRLAQQPQEAMDFREALRSASLNSRRPHIGTVPASSTFMDFCESAKKAGLISKYQSLPPHKIQCETTGSQLWKYVDGEWLEVYVWSVARDAGCFDDYRHSLHLPIRTPEETASNEVDLATTYRASLLIAECKTEKKPFDTKYLTKLHAIAAMVGGDFVSRLFIASQSEQYYRHRGLSQKYDAFCSQARAHQIVVVTGEQLRDLDAILRREAGADLKQRPTYSPR
ncbi:MAG: DUF1887 family protein [Chloroflexales bacterium]|nr:DUF1887 family protein [Chloroflexales bacterium]